MKSLLKVGIVITLSVITPSLTSAGVNQWTAVDPRPPGTVLSTLLIDPHTSSILYAGTELGFFKSTDGGAHWSASPIINATSLAIDPLTPATLYAGATRVGAGGEEAHIFKSTDGGQTWTDLGLFASDQYAKATVILDPQTKTTLYADIYTSRQTGFAMFDIHEWFLKSTDGGANWTPVESSSPIILPVGTCPTNPNIRYGVYAINGTLTRSTDGGVSWPSPNPALVIGSLVVDPANPNVVYGLYSFDSVFFSPHPDESNTTYEGVVRSTDCGESWTNLGTSFKNVQLALALDAATSSILYMGAGESVYEFRLANPPPEILGVLESPEDAQTVSGIGVVRGWTFVTRPDVQVLGGQLLIDGISVVTLPCCSRRDDVQAAFPQFPVENTLESGWGVAVNWGALSSGPHKVQVAVLSTAGDVFMSAPRTVTVVRPGEFEFVDQFRLSGAKASIVGDDLILTGVIVRDKATQQQKQVEAHFRWFTNSQSFGMVQAETTALLSSSHSVLSPLLASLSALWRKGLEFIPTVQAALGITSYFESPEEGQQVAGIGILRGWAFPEDNLASIQRIHFSVDGQLDSVVACCSARPDVAAVYNFDRTNAWFSGWGLQVNYGELTLGLHTLTILLESSNGVMQTLERTITGVRVGGFTFLDQVDLSSASARIEGEDIVLSGVQVRDKASQQIKHIEIRARWFQNSQSLGIVASTE